MFRAIQEGMASKRICRKKGTCYVKVCPQFQIYQPTRLIKKILNGFKTNMVFFKAWPKLELPEASVRICLENGPPQPKTSKGTTTAPLNGLEIHNFWCFFGQKLTFAVVSVVNAVERCSLGLSRLVVKPGVY